MPASSQLVTLEHAKDWAKRLVKSRQDRGETITLSQCQNDVAHMLGHAHWHALTRSYQATSTASTVPPAPGSQRSLAEQERQLLALINGRHPAMRATAVIAMSREPVQELNDERQFTDKVQEFKDDGGFYPEVIGEALEELLIPLYMPPGHLWIRVQDAEGKFYLVSVSNDEFGRSLYE